MEKTDWEKIKELVWNDIEVNRDMPTPTLKMKRCLRLDREANPTQGVMTRTMLPIRRLPLLSHSNYNTVAPEDYNYKDCIDKRD